MSGYTVSNSGSVVTATTYNNDNNYKSNKKYMNNNNYVYKSYIPNRKINRVK